MDEYVGGGWPIFYSRCIFPLPILGLFAILALRAAPLELELRTAIAIVCFSLAPYVLVSYYGGTSLGKNGNCRFSGWLGSANLTYV